MARHIIGIVAAGVATLLGGWVAVSAFALDDAGWTPVALSNTVSGSVLILLGALGLGLHVAALVGADRRRRPAGWSTSLQPVPVGIGLQTSEAAAQVAPSDPVASHASQAGAEPQAPAHPSTPGPPTAANVAAPPPAHGPRNAEATLHERVRIQADRG